MRNRPPWALIRKPWCELTKTKRAAGFICGIGHLRSEAESAEVRG
jgi:hypothetical protein